MITRKVSLKLIPENMFLGIHLPPEEETFYRPNTFCPPSYWITSSVEISIFCLSLVITTTIGDEPFTQQKSYKTGTTHSISDESDV